jgi:glycosyltransferase involved in cell wall biosynthesis
MTTFAIDLQACQSTDSAQRGIGRYIWNLCEALWSDLSSRYRMVILCSAHYPVPHRGWLGRALHRGEAELRLLEQLEPHTDCDARRRNSVRYVTLLEDCDALLIASPFEEGPGLAIPDSRDGLEHVRVLAIVYDLIPYRFAERYLSDPLGSRRYHARLQLLREADGLLAISEATRQDTIHHLDIAPHRVVNIFGGVSDEFTPITDAERDAAADTGATYGIKRPFLLYTGGDDWRKNLDGLITAYARLPQGLRSAHQLVIVCRLSPPALASHQRHRQAVGLAEDEVIFTGYIPDAQLRQLYGTCLGLVFPSHYEGFGLPVAEVMACGRPALAANNSSLPELVTDPEARFDAADPDGMAQAIARLLTDNQWREHLTAQAQARAPELTWAAVAARATDSLHRQLAARAPQAKSKPRLALFAPIPPQASGIADYSAHLALQLARHYRVTWVVDMSIDAVPSSISSALDVVSVHDFEPRADSFRRFVYQLGNSEFHLYQLPWLRRRPGTLVLHEARLDGLAWLADHELPSGIDALLPDAPAAALRTAVDAAPTPTLRSALLADALLWYATSVSLRCVVHSRHAQRMLHSSVGPSLPSLTCIPHGVGAPWAPADAAERRRLRQRWELGAEDFVLGVYGILAPSKGIELLVQALEQLPARDLDGLQLLLVGAAVDLAWLRGQLRRLERAGIAFRHTGRLPEADFVQHMRLADLAVSLRTETRGESSGALLQQLRHGLPTIVNDFGSFRELPSDVVAKVPVGDAAALVERIGRLRNHPEDRAALIAAAAQLLRERHWSRIACAYRDVCR